MSLCGNRCSGDLDIVAPEKVENCQSVQPTKAQLTLIGIIGTAHKWETSETKVRHLSKIALDSCLLCVLVELVKPKGIILQHLEKEFKNSLTDEKSPPADARMAWFL